MKRSWFTFLFFLLITLLPACGRVGGLSSEQHTQLQSEYDLRLNELRTASLSHTAGWPSDEDCDGALWAGVARLAGASWVDISAAVQPDGRPTRRPYSDCGPGDLGYNNGSASTTSNDMITGIMAGMFSAQDTDSAKRLWDYGYSHSWIMGEPNYYVSRVLLRPNGITMLARLLYYTSKGTIDHAVRWGPILYGPATEDFEGHLMILGRYLEGRLGGPQYGMEVAEFLGAKYRPDDAFAQAVAGNSSNAARLLLSNYKSPSYVRGHDSYHLVHWLIAARIALDSRD
jgi:hypothetical protein